MRVLVISKIFPNPVEPLSSPFNRRQMAALSRHCTLHIVAPIPWLPGVELWGDRLRAGRLSRLPQTAEIDGMRVDYLRAPYVPYVGAPAAYALLRAALRRWLSRTRPAWDVVLGTWIYPDACAAIDLAETLGLPCVVKAHGTDVNVLAQRPLIRPLVKSMLPRAAAAVAPSRPLTRELVRLGAPAARTHQVPNGVDSQVFCVRDRDDARRALGIELGTKLVLFVGRLDPAKGVRELLEALAALPRVVLAVVGDGPLGGEVRAHAARAPHRVIAPGARPPAEVALWMAAADVVTLPSYREGMPNTVLEALACGRPVVATRVGGIPDAIVEQKSGLLVPPRDVTALRDALVLALGRAWDTREITHLGPSNWDTSAASLERVLETALGGRPRGSRAALGER